MTEPVARPHLPAARELWGYAALWLVALVAIVRAVTQAVPGHYRVFTGAGSALWHLRPAYATDFGTGVGYFFYSPFCGLSVFGPLSLLPEKLGIALYMGVSFNLFLAGSYRFARAVLRPGRSPLLGEGAIVAGFPGMQWFLALIAPQVFGAIVATKLELSIAGLTLLALAWLLEAPGRARNQWRAAAALSLVLNWKFQPLPVIGLALIAWFGALWWLPGQRRSIWRFPVALAGLTVLWYALPFAVLPPGYLGSQHAIWESSLAAFVRESWTHFENVFAFADALGLRHSFAASQLASAAAGAALAAVELAWLVGPARDAAASARLRGGLMLAAGLGSCFIAAFSPLGQNNALILYAPLLLAALVAESFAGRAWRRAWRAGIAAAWCVMMFAYSDAVPRAAREAIRHYSVKAPAVLALGLLLAAFCLSPEFMRGLQREESGG